jgi:hypothetical protein
MTCFRRAVLVSIAGAFSIGACLATPTESSESVTSAAEDVSSTSAGLSFPYVFSTFFGDASQLLIYTSNDALNFNLFSATGYHGPSGTVRDPSIRKESDGTYYVTFTTPPGAGCCGPESTFAIAKSKDLKDWTTIATVPSGIADTHNTWAPEWFQDLDGSVYILASVSPTGGKDFRTYAYKAHNATYTSFSSPAVASSAAPAVATQRHPYRFLPGLGNIGYNGGNNPNAWQQKYTNTINASQGCYTLNGTSSKGNITLIYAQKSNFRPTGTSATSDNGVLGSWGACSDHSGTSISPTSDVPTRSVIRPLTY